MSVLGAVEKKEGPCVVFAGAGTGKTTTIVEKIKSLVGNGHYDPDRVVCLTFSNEAANSLLTRMRKVLNTQEGDKEPKVRTFHSFSADLLRDYLYKGDEKKVKILTPEEAKVVLHRYFKVQPYYCHQYVSAIGSAKDLGISIEQVEEYIEAALRKIGMGSEEVDNELEKKEFELHTLHLKGKEAKKEKVEIIGKINSVKDILKLKKFVQAWKGYEKLKEKQGYKDYSDLNRDALKLLREDSRIAESLDYLIVDEFQDTNKVQLDIIFEIGKFAKGITIVGDSNQSIYRFRGAYQHNIQDFKEHFNVQKKDIFHLDKSYRSPDKVLRTAHKLVSNNYSESNENFLTVNANGFEGDNVEVFEMNTGREEARKIIDMIKRERERGVEDEEICVMFRTHQQGVVVKRFLENESIDYCSISKSSLLKQPSVRLVIDYIKIADALVNWSGGCEQEWWDVLYRLSLEQEDLIRVGKFIRENKEEDCLSNVLHSNLGKLPLSSSGRMAIRVVLERLDRIMPLIGKNIDELLKEVYGIMGFARQESTDSKEIFLNLQKFLQLAENHSGLYSPDVGSFLHYLEILNSLGIDVDAAELEQKGIRLMTLHATKGLEYKVVIIMNLAEKRFPIQSYGSSGLLPLELNPIVSDLKDKGAEALEEFEKHHQLLEERRLCYVAFTRTKEKLILTYSKKYGNRGYNPSSFLDEIDYKNNRDIKFEIDSDNLALEELENSDKRDKSFEFLLNAQDFELLLAKMVSKEESKSLDKLFDLDKKVFSPSSLLLFEDCQKKFEYKYVYNMPEDKMVSWEAVQLGSFVHHVLEKGVKGKFSKVEEFLLFADELHLIPEWEGIDIEAARQMIEVFYERNKDKFSEESKTEQLLEMELGGIKFKGFADRIDFSSEGVGIIDYKTGKSQVMPKHRNWQLGFYALAASKFGKVKRVTLDMLRQEKPLSFIVDEQGNAVEEVEGRMKFNIYKVEEELVRTAGEILGAYREGFKACNIESGCEFCGEYVYGN